MTATVTLSEDADLEKRLKSESDPMVRAAIIRVAAEEKAAGSAYERRQESLREMGLTEDTVHDWYRKNITNSPMAGLRYDYLDKDVMVNGRLQPRGRIVPFHADARERWKWTLYPNKNGAPMRMPTWIASAAEDMWKQVGEEILWTAAITYDNMTVDTGTEVMTAHMDAIGRRNNFKVHAEGGALVFTLEAGRRRVGVGFRHARQMTTAETPKVEDEKPTSNRGRKPMEKSILGFENLDVGGVLSFEPGPGINPGALNGRYKAWAKARGLVGVSVSGETLPDGVVLLARLS